MSVKQPLEDELEAIAKAARQERCSRAEIVRRAVRAYLNLKGLD